MEDGKANGSAGGNTAAATRVAGSAREATLAQDIGAHAKRSRHSSVQRMMSETTLLQPRIRHNLGDRGSRAFSEDVLSEGKEDEVCAISPSVDGTSAYRFFNEQDTCPVDPLSWAAYSPVAIESQNPSATGPLTSPLLREENVRHMPPLGEVGRQPTYAIYDEVEQDLDFPRIKLAGSDGHEVRTCTSEANRIDNSKLTPKVKMLPSCMVVVAQRSTIFIVIFT